MSEHRLTETDMRMALLQRGHTESQVAHLLGDIKADAWDEGHKEGWGECWVEHTSYGTKPTLARNPYRKQEEA